MRQASLEASSTSTPASRGSPSEKRFLSLVASAIAPSGVKSISLPTTSTRPASDSFTRALGTLALKKLNLNLIQTQRWWDRMSQLGPPNAPRAFGGPRCPAASLLLFYELGGIKTNLASLP